MENVKIDPLFSIDSNFMLALNYEIISLEKRIPIPIPWVLFYSVFYRRPKSLWICCWSFSLIPIPVSKTETSRKFWFVSIWVLSLTLIWMDPVTVNLIALLYKLIKIYITLFLSVLMIMLFSKPTKVENTSTSLCCAFFSWIAIKLSTSF